LLELLSEGARLRVADASTDVPSIPSLEAKILPATLDWIATAKSTIRITLPSSKREYVFNVKDTGRAIATLQAACL
jgi:hypothetical protein